MAKQIRENRDRKACSYSHSSTHPYTDRPIATATRSVNLRLSDISPVFQHTPHITEQCVDGSGPIATLYETVKGAKKPPPCPPQATIPSPSRVGSSTEN